MRQVRNPWTSDEDTTIVETLAEYREKGLGTIDDAFEAISEKLNRKRTQGAVSGRWYSELRKEFNDLVGDFPKPNNGSIWTPEEDERLFRTINELKSSSSLSSSAIYEMIAAQFSPHSPKACELRFSKLKKKFKLDKFFSKSNHEGSDQTHQLSSNSEVLDNTEVVAEFNGSQPKSDLKVEEPQTISPDQIVMKSISNISTVFADLQKQNSELESKLSWAVKDKAELEAKYKQLNEDFLNLQGAYSEVMSIIDKARKLAVGEENGLNLNGDKFKTNSKSNFLVERA